MFRMIDKYLSGDHVICRETVTYKDAFGFPTGRSDVKVWIGRVVGIASTVADDTDSYCVDVGAPNNTFIIFRADQLEYISNEEWKEKYGGVLGRIKL